MNIECKNCRYYECGPSDEPCLSCSKETAEMENYPRWEPEQKCKNCIHKPVCDTIEMATKINKMGVLNKTESNKCDFYMDKEVLYEYMSEIEKSILIMTNVLHAIEDGEI